MTDKLEKDLKILAKAMNSFAKKHPEMHVGATHCTDAIHTWVTFKEKNSEVIYSINSWLKDGKYKIGEKFKS